MPSNHARAIYIQARAGLVVGQEERLRKDGPCRGGSGPSWTPHSGMRLGVKWAVRIWRVSMEMRNGVLGLGIPRHSTAVGIRIYKHPLFPCAGAPALCCCNCSAGACATIINAEC